MSVKTIRTIADLVPDDKNANRGTERGRKVVEQSLRRFGAGRSVVVDRNGKIIGGNKTTEAAFDIGLDGVVVVPSDGTKLVVVQRTDLDLDTQPEARAMAVADNRASEVGLDWDTTVLADLVADDADALAGLFSDDELDTLLEGVVAEQEPAGEDPGAQVDKAAELAQKWQTSPGQIWRLGEHRLAVGDCRDAALVARLMGGEVADILLNDPPYGMRLDADFSGMKNNLRFAADKGIKSGNRYNNVIGDHDDFDAGPVVAMFQDVKEQFWWGADYYAATLGDTMHTGAWLVWDKRLDESADKMFGSCFELLWSKQKHKRDILRHKWAGVFGTEKEPQRGRVHPNQKPVVLYEDILQRFSQTGAVVVDCFSGSGTTIIACERLGRRCRAVELDPGYAAVALQRWADMTGRTPVLVDE